MKSLRIFIGYDSKEIVAYNVLAHSINSRSSIPISISPISLKQLNSIYKRTRDITHSTEFSLSRFLVPYLSNYEGYSVFMDCDMLCKADIAELQEIIEKQSDKAVLVCKHNYIPTNENKFLGQKQTKYERKNWSSFMIFNNKLCKSLTPEYVNMASGLDLHRFKWIEDETIGELPLEWNWLVEEYQYNPNIKFIHYTNGGPWFNEYRQCDYSTDWFQELKDMNCARQTAEDRENTPVLMEAKNIISSEAQTLEALSATLNQDFVNAVELIINTPSANRVVITGLGKSGLVGQKISATLASTGTPSLFIHASEALHGDLGRITKGDVVVALSNSGETEEIIKLMDYIKELNVPIIAITSSKTSTLGNKADIVINIGKIIESYHINLIPSASTTAMMVLGDALAMCLCSRRGFKKEDFAKLHPSGYIGQMLNK